MLTRVPQPPVNPSLRSRENRPLWFGMILAIAGVLLAVFGTNRLTSVDRLQGGLAIEREVNLAFAHGGVQILPPPLPPGTPMDDPDLPEWAKPPSGPAREGTPGVSYWGPRWVIDAAAKDPCPT